MSKKALSIPNILSIAGSDPSGGAGIQADLKTIGACGGYGMAAITALTVQNTMGVEDVHYPPAAFVAHQVRAIFEDIRVDAVKIGMAGSAETIEAVAKVLQEFNPRHIVLDPVMVATSGDSLSNSDSAKAMIEYLFPLATLITPNIPESEVIVGRKFNGDYESYAKEILKRGCERVYLKGGHGESANITDVYVDKDGVNILKTKRIETKNTHGTGCTLSSALSTFLGMGYAYSDASLYAKNYITQALKNADQLSVGRGSGPVQHFEEGVNLRS